MRRFLISLTRCTFNKLKQAMTMYDYYIDIIQQEMHKMNPNNFRKYLAADKHYIFKPTDFIDLYLVQQMYSTFY